MGGEAAHRDLVLDVQDRLRAAGQIPHVLSDDRLLAAFIHARQEDRKRRADILHAIDGDVSAGLLHDAVARRQPEAGPLPFFLRGEKWLEDVLLHLRRHARAGVGHRELHVLAGGHFIDGIKIVHEIGDVFGRDRDRAALGHRVARIDAEIEQHLLELPRVGLEPPDFRAELRHDLDVLADHAPQHFFHVAHRVVDVDDAQKERLPAAEGEELVRERSREVRRLADFREVLEHPLPLVDLPDDQVAVPEDRGEDVVEVVRDPAREPADRVHLLRLEQLLLEPLALGDVARD